MVLQKLGSFRISKLMRRKLSLVVLLAAVPIASNVSAEGGLASLNVTQEVSGLRGPWGFDFLPDGRIVVTEKRGRLYLVDKDGTKNRLRGLPDIHVDGQGGLLDVAVSRDFDETGEIYLTFVSKLTSGSGTSVAKARLREGSDQLEDMRVIFKMTAGAFGGRHFGSRIQESEDGFLYLTIGDRGDRPSAQDLSRHNGSVLRIDKDGKAPSDNPFVGQGAAEIWSFGHRNPQGMDITKDGTIWAVEHGAKGGDEVNRIRPGANYGWPVIAYGTHYSGGDIGEGTHKEGMEQPDFYWDPSIAPSGLLVYEGDMFPEWKGDIFVGSLKFDYISRLDGSPLQEVEQLTSRDTKRVRDIREAPDGSIWFMSEDRRSLYRISR